MRFLQQLPSGVRSDSLSAVLLPKFLGFFFYFRNILYFCKRNDKFGTYYFEIFKDMKRLLILCSFAIVGLQAVSAQKVDEFGIFQHVGANVGVGSEGISVGVATPITDYLEASFGVNFMVPIKPSGNVNINGGSISSVPHTNANGQYLDANGNVTTLANAARRDFYIRQLKIKGNLSRTTFDFKLSAYPFGVNSSFFVTAGFSFGGKNIATLEGHSDEVAELYQWSPSYDKEISAVVDKYNIKIDKQGNASGDIRVNSFRPYFGLGFGRLVPKGRVGFRCELGAQLMGHMKVYQNDTELPVDSYMKGDDDISKIIDKLTVYPVLKFILTTRIL